MPGIPALVLISGPEGLLVERARASIVRALRDLDPDVELVVVDGPTYARSDLVVQTSPSLFGGAKCVVIADAHEGPDALVEDLLSYVADPVPEVTLVVEHGGGNRGKKALDAVKKAGARVIEAPLIKTDGDKFEFVLGEFRSGGRKITKEAARALVEAVGKDLRELASACRQLVDDTEGVVDDQVVERYHGGKVEATGFRIADAAIAGQAGEALRLFRHASATGLDPVPIVAVLASQLRSLAKVSGAGRSPSAQVASALGMAPWQVDKARRALGPWSDDGLAAAISAVAAADFEVKGGGRDPQYAVERVLVTIARARAHGD